ncbi:hypothetical protein T01_519 [Trichinella spiralis]|uniref:Uncharacterized protein n=1 Tax=Trichinella spiralis TaxID=6334 RepID=A0A0V1BX93_TRISP|nr:hypothetical protein T01_519 [Trichinella spiralis]
MLICWRTGAEVDAQIVKPMANRHRWYYVVEDVGALYKLTQTSYGYIVEKLGGSWRSGGDQRAGRRGNGDWMMNGTDKPGEIAGEETKKKPCTWLFYGPLFVKPSNGSIEPWVDELTNGQVEHRRYGQKKIHQHTDQLNHQSARPQSLDGANHCPKKTLQCA